MELNFRKKEVAYHVVPRQHYNFFVLFYFDVKEILSILLRLLVNSILTTHLFISGQAQFSSYLVPGGWCQTLLFTG